MARTMAVLILLLVLAGCGGAGGTTAVSAPPDLAVTCHAAYRAGPGQPVGTEELLRLDGPGTQAAATFADMALQALYSTGEGEGGRALALRVTAVDSAAPVAAQLYQLGPGQVPQNEFVGGHGFTGLAYAYHPGGAELQYWCVAGGGPP